MVHDFIGAEKIGQGHIESRQDFGGLSCILQKRIARRQAQTMKIILLGDKGAARTVRLSRQTAIVGATTLVLALAFCTFYLFELAKRPTMGPDTVQQWQERLEVQQAEVESMRRRSAAESEAVGRQLAQMQARLHRMEALGARVTEVAELDEGEFSFDEPAPQGGPGTAPAMAPEFADLKTSMDELAAGLKARESELEILESMLLDRDIQEAKAIAGRPVTWGWMSSKYGKRLDPFTGKSAWHSGVDFAGKDKSDVVAVAGGVVTYAGKRYGYGLMVEITHGDGYVTRYGHHAEILVSVGDVVKPRQVIGKMGSSGRSTGPHVHFEVLKNGKHVDPSRYVARRR
jgi:murein DD-endopeptidase MepM/ murein hydrolase activator NlpD